MQGVKYVNYGKVEVVKSSNIPTKRNINTLIAIWDFYSILKTNVRLNSDLNKNIYDFISDKASHYKKDNYDKIKNSINTFRVFSPYCVFKNVWDLSIMAIIIIAIFNFSLIIFFDL